MRAEITRRAHRAVFASLQEGTDQDFDLYIIDNGSPSVTVDELVQRFGDSHILRLPTNLGYAAGNYAGLAVATLLVLWQFLPWIERQFVRLDAEPRTVAARGDLAEFERATEELAQAEREKSETD